MPIKRKCLQCDKEFEVRAKSVPTKYCCHACAVKANRKKLNWGAFDRGSK